MYILNTFPCNCFSIKFTFLFKMLENNEAQNEEKSRHSGTYDILKKERQELNFI